MIEVEHTGRVGLLVFLHGFIGSRATFRHPEGPSLPELLYTDPWVSANYDCAYFSYETSLIRLAPLILRQAFRGGRLGPVQRNLGLRHLAEHLQSELELRCSSYSDIVLVGHSMGGLVAKAFLAIGDPSIATTSYHLLTLGTPHVGIPSVLLPRLWRWFGNPQLRDLASFNRTLAFVNERWSRRRHLFGYRYLYGLHDTVVPPNLAVPAEEKNFANELDQDHFSIARPRNSEADTVLRLLDYLHESSTTVNLFSVSRTTLESVARELWEREDSGTEPNIVVLLRDPPEWEELAQHVTTPGGRNLVVASFPIADAELANLHGQANRNGVSLLVWDKRRLVELLGLHPDLSAKHGLQRRLAGILLPRGPTVAPDLAVRAPEDFVDRKEERSIVQDFLRSPGKNVLILTGQGGVGKTALAAHCLYSLASSFDGIGGLRITQSTTRTDLFEGLRIILERAGVASFSRFARNSKFSDEQRLEVLQSLLSTTRLLIVIDNLEDALDRNRSLRLQPLAALLRLTAAERGSSKIILTSRVLPAEPFLDCQGSLHVAVPTFSQETVEQEYSAQLPRLRMLDQYPAARVYSMTGGNPLLLQLLDKYLVHGTLEDAYQRSLQSLYGALVGDLFSNLEEASRRLVLLIAIVNEGMTGQFLRDLEIDGSTLNAGLEAGLVEFNARDQTYTIHPVVRARLLADLRSDQKESLHAEVAACYGKQRLDLHVDHQTRHLFQRRRVRHLLAAGNYEEATAVLGAIGTRFLSFNSADELAALVDQIEGRALSPQARFWIVNLRAHMDDFHRNFNLSSTRYVEQLRIARQQPARNLIGLALNNVGTTHRRAGRFKEAILRYLRAYRIARNQRDQKLRGTVLNNLGQTYGYLGQLLKAAKVLEQAVEVRSSERDEFRLAATLSHLGAVYLKLAKEKSEEDRSLPASWLDRAYLLLTRSISMQLSQQNYWMLDRTYQELAKYWRLQRQTDREEEYRALAGELLDAKYVYLEPRIH